MTFVIEGIGTALPDHKIRQADAAQLHANFAGLDDRKSRTLRALYRRSRIDTRHSVLFRSSEGPLEERQCFFSRAAHEDDPGPGTGSRMDAYEEHAPLLALQASTAALDDADLSASDVTHLVTVSCTGFVSPGVDAALIETLGLDRSTERTHVGFMGCHGALNGLRVVRALLDRDGSAVPLLCAVELCSLHFAYGWDPNLLVANALFADGAAAVVGRDSASSEAWRVEATGSFLMEASQDAMAWRVGDHGFRITLSPRVPELIEDNLRAWLEVWLEDHGLRLEDVGSWAIHPGGPRILGAARSALALPKEATWASEEVLRDHGNMSSPTVLFILDRLRAEDAPRPCVALAFGPGLVAEATLLM